MRKKGTAAIAIIAIVMLMVTPALAGESVITNKSQSDCIYMTDFGINQLLAQGIIFEFGPGQVDYVTPSWIFDDKTFSSIKNNALNVIRSSYLAAANNFPGDVLPALNLEGYQLMDYTQIGQNILAPIYIKNNQQYALVSPSCGGGTMLHWLFPWQGAVNCDNGAILVPIDKDNFVIVAVTDEYQVGQLIPRNHAIWL